jgi:flagella basal body P-ring formation protein FlgA
MPTTSTHRRTLALAMLSLAGPVHATAADTEDPTHIREVAEQAVRDAAGPVMNLVVSSDPADPRLRLARCTTPLRPQLSGDGQLREHTTVAVRCEGASRWVLYVSVALATELPVLVAQRALARDAIPTAADFTEVVRRVPGASSMYVGSARELTGKRLRRPVAAGEALTAEALLTTPVVRRGQQLTLLAHAPGMDIRVTVVALMDGRPEERIRVQNPGSLRVVEATVRNSELVEIPL